MSFAGWPGEAVEFFEDLEEDNTKSFWQAHIETYEVSVKRPMEELLAELEPEFGAGKLFRPYRDVRFSKDKSPYKTNIAAAVGPFGYVTLSAEGLGVGAGMYVMASDQLERYRRAVDLEKSGTALELIVEAIKKKGYACAPSAPLKTAPKGYAKDHPRIALLNGKGIIVWKLWPVVTWLSTKNAKERVVDVLRSSIPLNNWLAEHVGDSELVSRSY
jgi:uncharacterized protein (TIGR02453 family)